jgi:myosin protein heavy chain
MFFPPPSAILRTVSGVLQFGNLQFKQERNSDQATLPDNTGLGFNHY